MPDIDLDFPRDIREVLIPARPRALRRASARRWSPPSPPTARAARCATSARRWGCPPGRSSGWRGRSASTARRARSSGHVAGAIGAERAASPRWRALAELCAEAMGLPRHASQHPGGMVISTRPLIDVCPVVPAAMEGRQIVQWDKDSCADAGFLKIDLLGLGMLSAVERCVEEIERVRGERIDLSRIPLDDATTYESIRAAETTGVFQIESRAQMQMLPAHPAARPRRPHRAGRPGAPRPDPGRRDPPLHRAPQARCARTPSYEVPYEHPLAGAGAGATPWGRSSSRSR